MSTSQIARLVLVSGVLLLPGAAAAQTAVSGTIAGVARDTTGAVMPGVTVEAASPALIEKVRTAITDGEGRYSITELRPGAYSVTFTLEGFSTFRREGIELTTGFTATVNAEMRVGSLQETVTVTGASPVVDVQNVRSQTVLSRAVIDTLPTGRTIQGYAALTPGVTNNYYWSQDVGGNKGDVYGAITSHGSRGQDSMVTFDGMKFTSSWSYGGGGQRFWAPNNAGVTEVAVETSGMAAETNTGGVAQNSVPKDGGNTFTVYFLGQGMNEHLQNSNLTDQLRTRGMSVISKSRKIWDFGGGVGGPIQRDKLWFYTAHRWWGSQEYAADVFNNKNQGIYVGAPDSGVSIYEPDYSRQGFTHYPFQDKSLRLTWQAAGKHRLSGHYSNQKNCMCRYRLEVGNQATEGNTDHWFVPNYLTSGTWSYPATNRLLFQAGWALMHVRLNSRLVAGATRNDISIQDIGTNLRYNASPGGIQGTGVPEWGEPGSNVSQHNERFSVSYVTGSHSFKAGLFTGAGVQKVHLPGVNRDVHYRFNLGVPVQLIQWATPANSDQSVTEVALFAQDQWTVGRLTLSLGARFDKITGLVPEQDRPAGQFVPALHVDRLENVPNFTDLSPRLGGAYDLFGNGKTAIKASLGRYLGQFGVVIPFNVNPANTLVASSLRTWRDGNGNYVPDCDLHSFEANGECGALDNNRFGTVATSVHWAKDTLEGFGNRDYNWQTSVSVQHELRPGMGVTIGYFRTSFGNHVVFNNRLTTADDYDRYCITAPVDPLLPGGGGYQICDLGDIKPAKFGLIDYEIRHASDFGNRIEVFDGVDTGFNARFGQGGLLQGGVSWGRTASQCVGPLTVYGSTLPSGLGDVKAPVQFCKNVPPFRPEFKVSGIYPLPFWGLQASATLQQLPGAPFGATSSGEGETNVLYVARSAEVKQSLGRDLAQGPRGVALITLVEPNTVFEDRLTQLDLRFAKIFQVGRARMQGMFDIYNILNSDTILNQQTRYGSTYPIFRQPRAILGARMVKFGGQLNF